MAKKILLISPVLVCAAVITALVLSGVGGAVSDATVAQIEQAKVEIVSLIKSGDYVGTDAAIKKLKADFALDTNLPDALYWLAGEFRWVRQYDRAGNLYNELAVEYGADAIGRRAALGKANVDVLALIDANEFSLAQAALSQLGTDFAGQEELSDVLYWNGVEFEFHGQYDAAKELYEQVQAQFHDNPYEENIRLYISKMTVLSLLEHGSDDEVTVALDKMIADFHEHPLLPHAVFMVGEKYFVDARAPDYTQKAIRILERECTSLLVRTRCRGCIRSCTAAPATVTPSSASLQRHSPATKRYLLTTRTIVLPGMPCLW